MKIVLINGSARPNGETDFVLSFLTTAFQMDAVYLGDYTIEFYNYAHQYSPEDQFKALTDALVDEYDAWIFCTPVYWYAMSGQTKVFLDRLTDLLKIDKEKGRKLRKKSMGLVYNSNGTSGAYIAQPFILTADYLGMHYLGTHYVDMSKSTDNPTREEGLLGFGRLIGGRPFNESLT